MREKLLKVCAAWLLILGVTGATLLVGWMLVGAGYSMGTLSCDDYPSPSVGSWPWLVQYCQKQCSKSGMILESVEMEHWHCSCIGQDSKHLGHFQKKGLTSGKTI